MNYHLYHSSVEIGSRAWQQGITDSNSR